MSYTLIVQAVAVVVSFTACTPTDRTKQTASGVPDGMAERGGMNAMPSMDSAGAMNRGGMVGASAGMMRDMRVHDQSLMSMRGSTLMAAIPEHRQRTADLVTQMQMDMRAGQFATTRSWDAMVDSVLNDLEQLPDLDVAGVTAMVPSHRARIRRLMAMHSAMMSAAKP